MLAMLAGLNHLDFHSSHDRFEDSQLENFSRFTSLESNV